MPGAVSHVKSVTIGDGTNTDVVIPSNWNSAHNHFVTISGNTAGQSTWSGTNLVIAASNDNTLSINGNTLVFQGNPPQSYWANLGAGFSAVTNVTPSQSTSYMVPFFLPYDVSVSFVRFGVDMGSASVTLGTTVNTTFSAGVSSTWNVVIYGGNTGGNSLSLLSIASGSAGVSQQWSAQMNSTGSQWSQTEAISYPYRGGTSSVSASSAASTSNIPFSTGPLSNFNGRRMFDVPLATSLSAGAYWLALGISSNTGGNLAAATGLRFSTINLLGAAWLTGNAVVGEFGTVGPAALIGHGTFSVVGGGTTASLAHSQIVTNAGAQMPFFAFHRSA